MASDLNISPDLAPPTGSPSAVEAGERPGLVKPESEPTTPKDKLRGEGEVETIVGMLAVGSAGSVSSAADALAETGLPKNTGKG